MCDVNNCSSIPMTMILDVNLCRNHLDAHNMGLGLVLWDGRTI